MNRSGKVEQSYLVKYILKSSFFDVRVVKKT